MSPPLTDKDGQTYGYDHKWQRVDVKRCATCDGSGFGAWEKPPYNCATCSGSGWVEKKP